MMIFSFCSIELLVMLSWVEFPKKSFRVIFAVQAHAVKIMKVVHGESLHLLRDASDRHGAVLLGVPLRLDVREEFFEEFSATGTAVYDRCGLLILAE
jgi:hypothetical protein